MHLAVAVRVYCSFVDPGQNGGGGTDRKRKADAPQRIRLVGPVVCLVRVFAVSLDHIWAVDDF